MIYKPAKGSSLTEEQAQRYGERIEVIIEGQDGNITPDDVVSDAKDKASPLHDFFEWNNARAANLYRTDQARYLLRSIHVVVKRDDDGDKEINIRAFYNVTDEKMKIGLLWYDDSPKTLAQKVALAVVAYKRKFGEMPTTCYVNPCQFPRPSGWPEGGEIIAAQMLVGPVEVAPLQTVLKHHFWIGRETQ